MKFDDEVAKKLNTVVGEAYDPPRRWSATIVKWLIAAILAVSAAAAIVGVLNIYLVKAHQAPPPPQAPKPVSVEIIPAK